MIIIWILKNLRTNINLIGSLVTIVTSIERLETKISINNSLGSKVSTNENSRTKALQTKVKGLKY